MMLVLFACITMFGVAYIGVEIFHSLDGDRK